MNISELPATATEVAPGVWVVAANRTRYYLDPEDPTLVVTRAWTDAETAAFNQEQATQDADHAALRNAIRARVSVLQAAVTQANTLDTSETTAATTVHNWTPTADLAGMNAVKSQIEAIHNALATLAQGESLAMTALADLATVVSETL